MDSPIQRIAKYNRNWNYENMTSISYLKFMLTLLINNTEIILVSRSNYITLMDENLKVVESTAVRGTNEGLYFKVSSSVLFVATSSFSVINVFNLNLTLLRNITVPYQTKYIAEYNGSLNVSSTVSFIMVFENEILT